MAPAVSRSGNSCSCGIRDVAQPPLRLWDEASRFPCAGLASYDLFLFLGVVVHGASRGVQIPYWTSRTDDGNDFVDALLTQVNLDVPQSQDDHHSYTVQNLDLAGVRVDGGQANPRPQKQHCRGQVTQQHQRNEAFGLHCGPANIKNKKLIMQAVYHKGGPVCKK